VTFHHTDGVVATYEITDVNWSIRHPPRFPQRADPAPVEIMLNGPGRWWHGNVTASPEVINPETLNARQAQELHDRRAGEDQDHDPSTCWCCCWDCNFDFTAVIGQPAS
jgi:hypothetical protein